MILQLVHMINWRIIALSAVSSFVVSFVLSYFAVRHSFKRGPRQ